MEELYHESSAQGSLNFRVGVRFVMGAHHTSTQALFTFIVPALPLSFLVKKNFFH